MQELRHLFESQWTNASAEDPSFNPQFDNTPWPQLLARRAQPAARATARLGCGPAPLHATATLRVYRLPKMMHRGRHSEGGVPALRAWHEYLYKERVLSAKGLSTHPPPWESGLTIRRCGFEHARLQLRPGGYLPSIEWTPSSRATRRTGRPHRRLRSCA